ncbi:unnamed protein product [Candidula unifasciata]|uniref:Uncharacterized protein n=1 Tax=Candidula unifasciata TaxID=100452 RepID=A0A8S3YTX5_9EUPU|nr:unnamed protein product [Candidula unifasciata]
MDNQANVPQELFAQVPFLGQLIYVLTTDQHLHNRGTRQLLKLVFVCMVVGSVLGYYIFESKSTGAAVGCFLALLCGDKTSKEVFSLVDGLQDLPVEQQLSVGEGVEDLVGSDSVVTLRNYVTVPNQYSKLVNFLRGRFQQRPREFSSLWIAFAVFVICLLF